ncbi:rod shape-determining protein MreC [Desulfoplanes formicivorans]|uniref:Cell shape-determining protein MreC n=1 Tax=Desulfoplanes formicivorans TaxID=1592317 RepID=A0A194AF33_9BACT|nr:rod shape-determining protein MreC [Desulfoplanes formicivorans]GAU08677.1 rod shape-determining protein MreC [Desulfoplanes formicivorans]
MALACLATYITIYTWNAKTGVLDRFVTSTGLEAVGAVLVPGKSVHREVVRFWERYVYLVGVRQENERLRQEMDDLRMTLHDLREKEFRVDRLENLLGFDPPSGWKRIGARVVGHRIGGNAVLQSLVIDKGKRAGLRFDTPVISPQGVIGRVHRPGLHFSTVLLLVDPNSHIPVMGATSRIPALVEGQGEGQPLLVKYVPLNDVLSEGEILVTSGLGGIFPKGLPVARVSQVTRSSISLFQDILAQPLVRAQRQEEVLLLVPEANATRIDDRIDNMDVSRQQVGGT